MARRATDPKFPISANRSERASHPIANPDSERIETTRGIANQEP